MILGHSEDVIIPSSINVLIEEFTCLVRCYLRRPGSAVEVVGMGFGEFFLAETGNECSVGDRLHMDVRVCPTFEFDDNKLP